MFEPDDAVVAGFLDRVVPATEIEHAIDDVVSTLRKLHAPSHALAKQRLRLPTMVAMREAIAQELTLAAYRSSSAARTAVTLPAARS
jgi:enoyl-CoA hydratase